MTRFHTTEAISSSRPTVIAPARLWRERSEAISLMEATPSLRAQRSNLISMTDRINMTEAIS
ncbi:MAG TPA: hypothetical protein PK325_07095 [Cyclobacteriaceae bacterium]|nr:hypothetical protein [Cyclobacteriaceae bacterium]HMV09421.1 hypothetical protein [Cyclobacteriaceae bacterium]HMV91466.1 hypothetical protein [Cyclobacteriaceae bacterium]HMX02442.1 hypothetical protein [Cyclobacteriaceae bacterium]HMX51070.1 hypothetical protein [Cyclobacteriaceae bacterium]